MLEHEWHNLWIGDIDFDLACAWRLQFRYETQESRFPAPVGAKQDDAATPRNFEIDLFNHGDFHAPLHEGFRYAGQANG